MSSPVQSHSKAIFRDKSAGAAIPRPTAPVYLVDDGAGNIVSSLAGPDQFAFVDVLGDGSYRLCSVTPRLLANVAGNLELSGGSVTPGAVMVDDGAGNLVASTDVRQAPAADFLADTGGNVWLVRRPWPRLTAALIGGNILFF